MYKFSESTNSHRYFPFTCHRFLLVGGKRTGANLHKDPKGSCAWNTLLSGRKRWIFFPPDSDVLALGAKERGYNSESPVNWWLEKYPKLVDAILVEKEKQLDDRNFSERELKNCRLYGNTLGMIECIQERDETIFIPSGWYHAVLNIEDFTVAATSNTLSLSMYEQQKEALKVSIPDFCTAIEQMEEYRALSPAASLDDNVPGVRFGQ